MLEILLLLLVLSVVMCCVACCCCCCDEKPAPEVTVINRVIYAEAPLQPNNDCIAIGSDIRNKPYKPNVKIPAQCVKDFPNVQWNPITASDTLCQQYIGQGFQATYDGTGQYGCAYQGEGPISFLFRGYTS